LRHPFANLRVGPARFNWLCSVSQPVFNVQLERWVRPAPPHEPISLLHLTNSNDRAPAKDRVATWYDWYQHVGLTR
jgi:hypothetical protein